MGHQGDSLKQTISTDLPGLYLSELTLDDTQDYYRLVDRNRDHLTQHGDYSDLKQATLESVINNLSDPADKIARFGIWLNDTLVGRVDLSPRAPGHFVIGYWLGCEYTGNGYATSACKALVQHGQDRLGATDIFAGVTKGNTASEALLGRLGFERAEDRGKYTLFQLPLSDNKGDYKKAPPTPEGRT